MMTLWKRSDRSPSKIDEMWEKFRRDKMSAREVIEKPLPPTVDEVESTNRALSERFSINGTMKITARTIIVRAGYKGPVVVVKEAVENRKNFMDRDMSRIWTKDEVADLAYKFFGVRKPPVRKPPTLDQLIAKAAGRLRRAS